MRIAFFTETFLPATDGVVTRLRHTLQHLSRMGDEMLVIAPRYPEGGPQKYAGALVHRVRGVPFPPYPEIKLAPANPGVGRVLGQFAPEVIHAVNPFILGASAPYYARRLGVPLVASYHTNVAAYTRFYKLGFLHELTRWYTRTVHNRAAVNLCTSRSTLQYLKNEGIRNLRLWPQGVDAQGFHPDKASDDWRYRLSGGHPGERLLLFVGRLAPEKGIERLKAVVREVPRVRVAIVGDGPARGRLEREFAGEKVVFTGMLQGEDLAAAFASADAFLFPSTTETLGMAMIEALASGLPVVAARSGASQEVIREAVDGLLYEPGSTASLVGTVRRVLDEEGLLTRLARGARASGENRDWASSTQALRRCYRDVVEER